MSALANDYMARERPIRASEGTPRVSKRFRVQWLDLLRPEGPSRVEVMQALETLRWMVASASGYPGVLELLSMQPTCVHFTGITPLCGPAWKTDLLRRFHWALLCAYASPGAQRWRRALGITPDGEQWITAPHVRTMPRDAHKVPGPSEHEVTKRISSLLAFRGEIGVSLNCEHTGARSVCNTALVIRKDGIAITVAIDYLADTASSWTYSLATQREGEPLLHTIERAERTLDTLKTAATGDPDGPHTLTALALPHGLELRSLPSTLADPLRPPIAGADTIARLFMAHPEASRIHLDLEADGTWTAWGESQRWTHADDVLPRPVPLDAQATRIALDELRACGSLPIIQATARAQGRRVLRLKRTHEDVLRDLAASAPRATEHT